jgi:putative zinc finger/helix-turn-helix YgiT family protein
MAKTAQPKVIDLICPACETGKLVPFVDKQEYSYKGSKYTLEGLGFSRCSACNAELVTPAQAKNNELRIREEQRKLDGLLSGAEIQHIRARFNLTQSDASVIFGGGKNAFSKYERGEVIQSLAMDRLLRLVDLMPSNLAALLNISGVSVKGARAFYSICDYGMPCANEGMGFQVIPQEIAHARIRQAASAEGEWHEQNQANG